jgi:hypothetical protein
MGISEEALRPVTGHFAHGVDKLNFAFAISGLLLPADDDTGFHRRVVEQVRTKAGWWSSIIE